MKNQKNRSMKVHSQSGRNYKATPTIILKGQWLQEMGFELDHLKMPELISNEYPVYMSEDEEELYSDMAEDLFLPLKGGEVTAANAAALSGKLMQMANGAVYSDDGDEIQIHDQKLDALED